MDSSTQRTSVRVILGVVLLGVSLTGFAAETRFAGRAIVDVLRDLRGTGLQFLYSSQLLQPSLRVTKEPTSSEPAALASEILAPHGLALSPVGPGLFAVVSAADTRSVAPPAEDPPPPAAAPEREELAEVVVATSRYAAGDAAQAGVFVLEGRDLEAQPGAGEDSIRSLARLPGIAQSGASAQSNIRGGEASEVLVLLDGFNIRQAFHLPAYQSLFSVVDPTLIAEAEVFTGGFPARYGNRMSGVFDLRTIDPMQAPRHSLGLSFFNAFGRTGGRIDPLDASYLVSARVGTLKPLLEAFRSDAGSPSYSDVYARAERADLFGMHVTANILWARDELSIADRNRGEAAELESRSRYVWLRGDREWSDDLVGSVWLGHSRIDGVRNGSVNDPFIVSGAVADSRASEFWDAKGRLEWRARERHWLETGFEWTDESAAYRYDSSALYTPAVAALFARAAAATRDFDLRPARDRVALFGTHRWRATDAVTTEIGVRLQRILTRGAESEWMEDPRVSLRWQIAPHTSLRLHWGRFHQADEIQELRVEDGVASFPSPQRVDHLIFGIEHRFEGGVGLRVEGFRKDQSSPRARFENALDTLSILPELAPDRVLIAPDFAEVRGMELSLGAERAEWRRWAAITWSQAVDEIDGGEVPRSWDQTWAATLGTEWMQGPWRLGAIAGLHRGWPTTSVLPGPAGVASLGARNRTRLPGYGSLDVRAEYRRSLALGSLALALEVTNATDRRNLCCTELRADQDPAGAGRLEARGRSWLPMLPSLSVRWDF